jgi:hypothetical protein
LIYICKCAFSLIRRFRVEKRKICISESQFDLPETSLLLTFLFSTKYSILITYHLGSTAPGPPGSRKWPTTTAKSKRNHLGTETHLGPRGADHRAVLGKASHNCSLQGTVATFSQGQEALSTRPWAAAQIHVGGALTPHHPGGQL